MANLSDITEARRYRVTFQPLEVRAQEGRMLTGRLLSYGREYDLGRFTETYQAGCFRKSIGESARSLPLLVEHVVDPVGLSVSWMDDADGLSAVWEFDTSADAQEAARRAEKGLLGGLSVGYHPIISSWDTRPDGRPHAFRREARMLETSLCAIPALDDAAVVSVRSLGMPATVPTPHLDEIRSWLEQSRAARVSLNG